MLVLFSNTVEPKFNEKIVSKLKNLKSSISSEEGSEETPTHTTGVAFSERK